MNIHSAVSLPQATSDDLPQIDAGIECLAVIGAHYRRPVDREHLKHELNLDDRQTDAKELAKAARMAGLKSRLFTGNTVNSLIAAPRPLIVEIGGEFALLLAAEGDRLQLLRPQNRRTQVLSLNEFTSEWTGTFILVTRRPDGLADRFGHRQLNGMCSLICDGGR